MKKILFLFLILFTTPSFAYYTENIPNSCGGIMIMEAVFAIMEYKCNSGYFLPANTPGCQPCPNGYTCNGGTYIFNETTRQGITGADKITQNSEKSCASNMGHSMRAVFAPNVINLNWYLDENATAPMTVPTASQQCTYDTKIVLPPEPTRPGYIFSGWKLKKNN